MAEFLYQYDDILIRMLLAAFLGALIGLERDKHGRAAGLRTHLLVSLGAAVFTILSESIAGNANKTGNLADQGRIAAQIVSGIGFLGAGSIIKEGINVRGLTTAACLWAVAAIGMASGSGNFIIAVFTTILALLGLTILKFSERFYYKDAARFLSIRTPLEVDTSQIVEIIQSKRVRVKYREYHRNYKTNSALTKLSIRINYRGGPDEIANEIISKLEDSSLPLEEIRWEHN